MRPISNGVERCESKQGPRPVVTIGVINCSASRCRDRSGRGRAGATLSINPYQETKMNQDKSRTLALAAAAMQGILANPVRMAELHSVAIETGKGSRHPSRSTRWRWRKRYSI